MAEPEPMVETSEVREALQQEQAGEFLEGLTVRCPFRVCEGKHRVRLSKKGKTKHPYVNCPEARNTVFLDRAVFLPLLEPVLGRLLSEFAPQPQPPTDKAKKADNPFGSGN